MQIVIDTMQCPCRTLNDKCDISGGECYEDDICSPCPLIRNGGIKLPEGHGRLIDEQQIIERFKPVEKFKYWCVGTDGLFNVLSDAPTIIEADKESEDKK